MEVLYFCVHFSRRTTIVVDASITLSELNDRPFTPGIAIRASATRKEQYNGRQKWWLERLVVESLRLRMIVHINFRKTPHHKRVIIQLFVVFLVRFSQQHQHLNRKPSQPFGNDRDHAGRRRPSRLRVRIAHARVYVRPSGWGAAYRFRRSGRTSRQVTRM